MRRRTQRRKPRLFIVFAFIAVIVIVFAFIMEQRAKYAQSDNPDPHFGSYSPVQAEINELGWIMPMPLTINEFSRPGDKLDAVTGIVIHNIGNPNTTAQQNRNFFENLKVTQQTSVSSNFIICLDGQIVQCIPVDEVAYASNFRNYDTISIEVCHPDDTGKFGDETYAATVRLTAWLCSRFGLSANDVLRHYDVYDKECPRYYVQNEDAWEQFKADVTAAMGE